MQEGPLIKLELLLFSEDTDISHSPLCLPGVLRSLFIEIIAPGILWHWALKKIHFSKVCKKEITVSSYYNTYFCPAVTKVARMFWVFLMRKVFCCYVTFPRVLYHLSLLSTGTAENPIAYGSLGKEVCPLPILKVDAFV